MGAGCAPCPAQHLRPHLLQRPVVRLPGIQLTVTGHSGGFRQNATLALGALGVVYGDIGTSPLYALHECFSGEHGATISRANIFGALSLIVWALIVIVTIKYLAFVMRADNRGEGGIIALMALVSRRRRNEAHGRDDPARPRRSSAPRCSTATA